ncbi:hypothetical protein ACTOVJ_07165 [Arcanobacterium canis]
MRNNSKPGARGATKDVHFNCPADLLKQMRVYAALNDTNVTALIINSVTDYLDRQAPSLREDLQFSHTA